MATQGGAVRRNAANSTNLLFLAPIFAIASFVYTFLFPSGTLSAFAGSAWLGLRRETQSVRHEADGWLLETTKFSPNRFQAYPYVSNGYFGQTLPAEGVGYWVQKNSSSGDRGFSVDWPLDEPRATFGTVAGFFNLQDRTNRVIWTPNLESGGESVISGIPDWTGLIITTETGESYLPGVNPSTVERYVQSMSLRNGMVQTNISWAPEKGGVTFDLNFTVFAHQENINLGIVRLDVTANKDVDITITDVLDGAGATRATFQSKLSDPSQDLIWTSVSPSGQESVVAFEYSTVRIQTSDQKPKRGACKSYSESKTFEPWINNNASTISQSWCLRLKQGTQSTVYKYVGIATTDAFAEAAQSTARKASLEAKASEWEEIVQSHNYAWDSLWESADIVIAGDEEIQKITRASLFHLLTNTRPAEEGAGIGDNSISPSGLTSDSYAGYIFWDADIWVAPSLLALQPGRAASINHYRLKLHEEAKRNTKQNEFREFSGALYPWTSGRFGNCTGNGICAGYQYHINADIAMAHWHYFLYTNDLEWLRHKAWPVILAAAEMFVDFVEFSLAYSNGTIWTFAITDPDEDAIQVNNGAYTNTAIKLLLGSWGPAAAQVLNISIPSVWRDIADSIPIPFNSEGDLVEEYSGMPGDIRIKQADVVLMNYPLDYGIDPQVARNNLDYYSLRNSPSGPQMTWSMHAISEGQLQTAGCAIYTYLLYSALPYVRPPFYQFSELIEDDASINGGTEPAFPFLTGHGGYLQIFTHGLTGMRPRSDGLYLDPTLPPQLNSGGVQIKGVKWRGALLDIDIQAQSTTVFRRGLSEDRDHVDEAGPIQILVGSDNPKSGNHLLYVGKTLTIPTRQPHLNAEGNHALCKTVSSDVGYMSGHFPLSVVDGSSSSIWRPSSPLNRSGLTIDLGKRIERLLRVEITWGISPPEGFSVSLRSKNTDAWMEVFMTENVTISAPFDPSKAKEVRILDKNISIGIFEKSYDARYARLTVWGAQGGEEKIAGPTVGEFKIF